ncbi:hypothetical protein [Pontibaca methylaminivorans]|uniref:Argininosuccinate lyase n=1 Tax=Pontibaca methylaminivorans TaxID=515897 RepID=A0A1R3WJI0_9RHOB|nr:hypothetical protein [Pontibaca methylaminivorans]SIT78260.1 hypothetical protein SAMN05421849_0928 [Pontibaca methylaminivorans]
MNKLVLLVLAALALAACGVDGEPVRPSVGAGVGISSGGRIHTGGSIGLHRSPVSLHLGV